MRRGGLEFRAGCLNYEIYCGLRESVGWENFCREQAERALRQSAYDIVVFEGGAPVAMGRLLGDGLYYHIVDIIVRPERQRSGIGSRVVQMLLEYAEQTLPEGGRASVILTAERDKESFYERRGFKKIPHEFCGGGMRKVLYKEKGESC